MPTNTNRQTSSQAGSIQPGISKHDPWDDVSGSPVHYGDDSKHNSDNGSGNYSGKGNYDNGQNYVSRNNSAVDSFRNSENAATSSREPSYYRGNGNKTKNDNSQSKAKGKKKGIGAIITIALILAGGGAFLGASNSLLAPALSALTTSSTQTSYTSYTIRARNLTKNMLNNYGGGAITTNWKGAIKYANFPSYMKKRLAKYGIKVTGSGNDTRLSWTHTTSTGGTETISDIDAQTFLKMYNDDVDFREDFTRAKRGRVATFFDNVADKIYRKLGLSRNIYNKYQNSNDADTDTANYRSIMSDQFETGRARVDVDSERYATDEDGNIIYETDSNGNPTNRPVIEDAGSSSSGVANGGSASDMDVAVNSAQSFLDSAARVTQVGTVACTIAKVGSSIALAAAAMEMVNSINYFMKQMEPISKVQYGNGNESPINPLLNLLSTSYTTEVENFGSTTITIADAEDQSHTIPTEQQTGSALESGGLLAMLAGATGSQAKSKAKNYSLERIIIAMGGGALVGAKTSRICNGVSATQSLISIATAIGTAGASIVTGFFTNLAKSAATQIIVSAALSFIIPTVAKVLFANTFNITNGISAGEMLARGAAAANMREGRSGSGQSPSTKSAVLAFNQSTNQVLAYEAEQDRARLSPFDTSNRNTFFGSIAYSLLPTITSTNLTGLSSFLRSTTSSLSSIISRNVSAEGEGSSYLTTFGDCPMLDEIGVVGDIYCNPIVTTDMTTIDIDPNDASDPEAQKYNEVINDSMEECDDDGNCSIRDDSDLAHYITFCDGRDSPFGAVDQNILGAFELDNFILNSTDGISDVMDLINAGIDEANLAWATGENCVNTTGGSIGANDPTNNNSFWNTKGKYYQRYVEDQRILEQMGAYEGSTNPVTAYEERYEAKYLEEHPEANTYIGYLSRISGLTPENTKTALAFINYYTVVNEYDPTLRIAMQSGDTTETKSGEEVVATILNQQLLFSDHDLIHNPIETNSPVREHIIYFDLRNRSYVA